MENKQTAIDWINSEAERLSNQVSVNMSWAIWEDLIKQAKEMEKQQIINAYKEGHYHLHLDSFNPEQYYNETFKSEE